MLAAFEHQERAFPANQALVRAMRRPTVLSQPQLDRGMALLGEAGRLQREVAIKAEMEEQVCAMCAKLRSYFRKPGVYL